MEGFHGTKDLRLSVITSDEQILKFIAVDYKNINTELQLLQPCALHKQIKANSPLSM